MEIPQPTVGLPLTGISRSVGGEECGHEFEGGHSDLSEEKGVDGWTGFGSEIGNIQ